MSPIPQNVTNVTSKQLEQQLSLRAFVDTRDVVGPYLYTCLFVQTLNASVTSSNLGLTRTTPTPTRPLTCASHILPENLTKREFL